MAENTLPKKNVAYTFFTVLVDTGNRPDFKANPTLAAADVQVSTDGLAFGNIDTLPVVTPASGRAVKVDLSASEMNGDNVVVQFVDVAGNEWDDLIVEIRPATRKAEDLAYPTTSGRSIDVAATGEVGIDLDNTVGTLSAAEMATDVIGSDELATSAINAIRDAILSDSLAFQGADLAAILLDTATTIPAQITALNDLSAAQVNSEVSDVFKTDTVTLPGQIAPPLTPTLEQMLAWLYKVLRNRKDQTSTAWRLYADNEITVDAKSVVSSDGTVAVKQEIIAGP